MQVNPKIFKAYDIRGVYPEEVNEEVAYLIGRAFIDYVTRTVLRRGEGQSSTAPNVVVGQDMRVSSPALTKAVVRGITEQGVNVLDIGLAPTPTFYFAVRHLKAAAGIQVSASHNPKEYNGFKVVLRDKIGIVKVGIESGLQEIRDLVMGVASHPNPSPPGLRLREPSGSERRGQGEGKGEGRVRVIKGIQKSEIDAALKIAPLPKVMPPLKVVADPANAMGIPMLKELFKRVPSAKLIKMNFKLDGTFPAHQPDPLQAETMRDLQARVLKEKADFGIAPDGDADRIFFVDERGEIVPASLITAFIAREVLGERRTPSPQPSPPEGGEGDRRKSPLPAGEGQGEGQKILYDIRYTLNAKHAIEQCGGTPIVSKVGHAFISQKMREEDAIFAGESSGHYFFRSTGYGEGTPLVILYILRALVREKKPLSKVLAPLIAAHESGEINFKLENREKAQTVLQVLEEKYKDGEISKLDGIAVEYPDWRFSVRASNTEPLLRLNIEATTEKMMQLKRDELVIVLNHES